MHGAALMRNSREHLELQLGVLPQLGSKLLDRNPDAIGGVAASTVLTCPWRPVSPKDAAQARRLFPFIQSAYRVSVFTAFRTAECPAASSQSKLSG